MLTPAFALSGTLPINPPTYENMSSSELDAFLVEMESDIRGAERDLREISTLENKGVTGAGKLGDYEALQPRLEALLQAHDEDLRLAADLEKRIALLMDHYATNVRVRQPGGSCLPFYLSKVPSRSTPCPNSSYLGTKQYATPKRRLINWRRIATSDGSWATSRAAARATLDLIS